MKKVIFLILIIGILLRLDFTADNRFLFNMDNARDMVDVREMVVLKKLRLIGPTSAIEGFYNGPFWYYLLAIPFILSGGNPYASILMEISLWVIGGFFLLKLVARWGRWLIIPIGAIWVASNYIVLTNLYAFNPNPIPLLTPLFIYLFIEYLNKSKPLFIIFVWFLAGLFFNFEMNFGVFTPAIIIVSLLLTKKLKFLKDKYFWIGVVVFIATLLPQLLFDFRHQFIMSKSVIKFLSEDKQTSFDILRKIQIVSESFYNVFVATLMNRKILSLGILLLAIPVFKKFLSKDNRDILVTVCLVYTFLPFLIFLIAPVTPSPWHLGGEVVASLILIAFMLSKFWQMNFLGKLLSLFLSLLLVLYPTLEVSNYFLKNRQNPNLDPSLLKNELQAIDFVYTFAKGQNFKVYTYLPSVYDYPYQYLFWWIGLKKYGYIPGEYVYSPNKPQYIPSQDKFQGEKDNFSGLVFLIKEPDRIGYRTAWENDYKDMVFVSKEMIGPIEVEVRKDIKKQ